MRRVLSAAGRRCVHARGARLARQFDRLSGDCRQTQEQTLARLLRLNAGSRFHTDHRLAPGLSVDDFRRRLPVTSYDDVAPYIEDLRYGRFDALCGPRNKPLMFALSSGTTGEAKHIPVTTRFLADYRRGWMVWAWHAFEAHPTASARRFLQLAGDHNRFTAPCGLPCGNISGLVQAMQNRFVRSKYVLPAAVTRIEDPAARRHISLRLALADPDVSLIVTANPSTLIQLAQQADDQKEILLREIHDGTPSLETPLPDPLRNILRPLLARKNPDRARQLARLAERNDRLRPCDYWPHAALVGVWTGGSCAAYLPALREWFAGIPLRDHGLSASEGRMTIPLQDGTSTGILDVASHFFEFVPEADIDRPDPQTLLAHQLTEGDSYYILLTTASGLYRYNICDVVRCRGFAGTTPLLEFLHKGAHISNLTGEKLTESQVVAAVAAACETTGHRLSHFTLCPAWGTPPGYRLLVEDTALEPHAGGRVSSAANGPAPEHAISSTAEIPAHVDAPHRVNREATPSPIAANGPAPDASITTAADSPAPGGRVSSAANGPAPEHAISSTPEIPAHADAPHRVHREATPSPGAEDRASANFVPRAANNAPHRDAQLAAAVDAHLQQLNCEYRDKRVTGRLSPLRLHRLPAGTWQAFIAHHHTRPGSTPEQYKHPCLTPDLNFLDQLTRLANG